MSGFTKVPNDILDAMGHLNHAAFKLAMALCRLTYGFHRDSVEMSLRELQKITGISRQGIINASQEIGHLFTSATAGKTTIWVVKSVDQSPAQVVKSVDRCGQMSVPGWSNDLTSTGQMSVPITSGLKKVERNTKENTKESDSHELISHFTMLTGCFPPGNPETHDDWMPVIELWQSRYNGKVADMMALAVDFARGNNDKGKRYHIRSPKSIANIMANLDVDTEPQKVKVSTR